MKRILLAGLFILGWGVAQAQVAVVAPSLELQEAMNHAEQLQQMVQAYQTMVNVKDGINKGIDAVEKVNNKLATIRDVQEIATRSAACVGRIKQVYEMPGGKERYWDQVALEYHLKDYQVQVRPCTFEDIIEIDNYSDLKKLDSLYT